MLAGKHVRLSGQDCERGTFNQRHSVIFCRETGRGINKINQMVTSIDDNDNGQQTSSSRKPSAAWFIAANSPLSEHAVLGFEYGFSVESENEAVTIWEAQFGDFANNAQVIIDQFLLTGEER